MTIFTPQNSKYNIFAYVIIQTTINSKLAPVINNHWLRKTKYKHVVSLDNDYTSSADQDDQEYSSVVFLLSSHGGNSTQCKPQHLSREIQMHLKSSTQMLIYYVWLITT